jgi:hypothetical protein
MVLETVVLASDSDLKGIRRERYITLLSIEYEDATLS